MEMQHVDKVAWLYIKDRKILSTLSKGKDTYYIPGGKRDEGETDEQCIIREIKEELSVDLKLDTLNFAGEFEAIAHGKNINIKMKCYFGEYDGELKPSNEIQEMIWLTYSDKVKSSPVDKLVFEWLRMQNLID
jgi:8-oxo-dGTP diphosphatase